MKQKTLEALEFIGAAIIIAEVLILAGLHINAHAETVEVGIAPGETEYESTVIIEPNPYRDLIDGLDGEERYLIKAITWAEANNQGIEGQRACIEVILNRVLSPNWPDTVTAVLSQKGQFATWKYRHKVTPNADQEEALRLVYEEAPVLPSTKYVYFDRKGRNGINKIRLQDHSFGAEK